MNTTVFVKAYFLSSRAIVDGERLTKDVQTAISRLNAYGYEVISLMPVTSAYYPEETNDSCDYSDKWGNGSSYTEGVVILGRKTN